MSLRPRERSNATTVRSSGVTSFAEIDDAAGAFGEGAVFAAQGHKFLEELIPLLARLEGPIEEVAFKLDAFLVGFASVGTDDSPSLVARLAAGMDGGAVDCAEFFAGQQEGEGFGGKEGEGVHGAEAAGTKAIKTAAFVVVVGVSRGEARTGEAAGGILILHQDVGGAGGNASILPGVKNGPKAVVVLGVTGQPQVGVAMFIHGIGVLAELVEVVIVGGVYASFEEVGVVVEAVAFGHE